jgi:D-aminoacyl-tRNA deacylase
MTQTLRALARARDLEGYAAEVTFEATHHGPRLESPAFFVELGSDATAWEDPTGGRTVARAVHEALRTAVPDYPVAVGLGGGHYAPRFTEAALTRRVHYGHLWPRYHMNDRVDVADLLAKAVAATPGCTGVHIHDGTVPRTLRPAFDEAMRALGMEPLESARWEAAGPEKELRRAHQ